MDTDFYKGETLQKKNKKKKKKKKKTKQLVLPFSLSMAHYLSKINPPGNSYKFRSLARTHFYCQGEVTKTRGAELIILFTTHHLNKINPYIKCYQYITKRLGEIRQ